MPVPVSLGLLPQPPVAGGLTPGAPVGFWAGALGDVELGVVDDDGTAWLWRGLDGWDGPPLSGAVTQRAADHGGWAGPQFMAPRALTLRISALAPSWAARDAARTRLQAALPIDGLVVLRYDEPVPTQALVRRSGTLSEDCPNLTDADFTIGLVAPDPRKYATTERVATIRAPATAGTGIAPPLTPPLGLPHGAPPTAATATNGGNTATRPVATITGAIAAPALVNASTGQAVSYPSLVLGAGDVLVVDFDSRQGYLGGAFRPASPASSWWELAPGPTTVMLAGTSDGSATATLTWRDAYL